MVAGKLFKVARTERGIVVRWKKYWGIIPIGIVITLQLCISIISDLTDSVLRSIPQIIMIWLTIIPVLIFVFWICNMCCKWEKSIG